MNVTKLDLCTRVAKRFYVGQSKTCPLSSVTEYKDILEVFLDEIFLALAEGYRIEIRGFGCFKPTVRKKRKGRNPRTGDLYDISAYIAPSFKFSKEAQKIFQEKLIIYQEKTKPPKKCLPIKATA